MPQHTHAHPQGGIRRGPRLADNFSVLSNALLNDERLSFRARGLLAWLLSKPADWHIRSEAIAAASPLEGREAIRTVMRELIAAGYLVREKHRDADGRFSTIQTIYEVPGTPGETPEPPTPRKAKVGRARDGKTGAFTKNPSPRTETNNNPAPQAPTSLGDALATVSSSEITREELKRNRQKIADLEAATLAVGLPASYSRIKPDQKRILLELIDRHGIDALAQAAVRAHRPENPTMHVHGWIRLWQAMSASGATRKDETPSPAQYNSAKCPDCDDIGMVMNENDLGVRCHCRTTRAAA
ncbi:hypothetical protein [Rhodococcus zopfii]|uniref:hypothetical protein n=1 Tax=Rhodococcus zopfii TaxID=43772 RepID=UPI0009342161|nr:hypothetical protein [Rhodococcus zopfii]